MRHDYSTEHIHYANKGEEKEAHTLGVKRCFMGYRECVGRKYEATDAIVTYLKNKRGKTCQGTKLVKWVDIRHRYLPRKDMLHKEERIRHANSRYGTKVWAKPENKNEKWTSTNTPSWTENIIYIVDDKWAELRKAQVDGKQLQVNYLGEGWKDAKLKLRNAQFWDAECWRVKPEEPIYEWQFCYFSEKENRWLTTKDYHGGPSCSSWVKLEESKKERND